MNRRTLLRGITAGNIASIASVGTVAAGGEKVTDGTTPSEGEPPAEADGSPADGDGNGNGDETAVIVRLVDVPDAVTGGAFLEWAVEVENPTDRAVRPTVDFFVDGESLGSAALTVEPGETVRPTTPSYPTEPVAAVDEVTVRVEVAGDADERTVRIRPAPELDEGLTFPKRSLTVEPQTTVHFEVDAVDPQAIQTTTWWVDGELVGDTLADPWQGVYFVERGAHFWQQAFDAEGTHEVVAGIGVDDEQYRASWTVTVAPEGLADPTIEAARPKPGALSTDDGPTTLEVDVADPDGNLDRVVWWLTQADEILGVSEVSGTTDTATLTVDGLCQTCAVVPWVITGDGTFASEPLWVVDPIADVGDLGLEDDISPADGAAADGSDGGPATDGDTATADGGPVDSTAPRDDAGVGTAATDPTGSRGTKPADDAAAGTPSDAPADCETTDR